MGPSPCWTGTKPVMYGLECFDRSSTRILIHRVIREAGLTVERRGVTDRARIDGHGAEDALRELRRGV